MKAILFINSRAAKDNQLQINKLKSDLKVHGVILEEVNSESANGSERSQIYDVVSFPAVVITREDGGTQSVWQGEIPDYAQISEAVGYI
jgi:hypothetical protein